jgi:prepilin-type processing-associated H-X9-DG protein
MNNAKQLCLAMAMYCEDNDGSFPPVDNWPDVLKPYLGNEQILTSPFAPEAGRAWAMNKHLDGWKLNDIRQPARTVLIFESRFNGPPAGDRELLPENPRTIRGYVIGFVDGHVESVRPYRLDEFIWKPGNQPLLDDR